MSLAFLALTQHRLGKQEEARTTLRRLRGVVNQPEWVRQVTAQAVLRELEALEQDLAFPADHFAI
jgi:hypothetical protein